MSSDTLDTMFHNTRPVTVVYSRALFDGVARTMLDIQNVLGRVPAGCLAHSRSIKRQTSNPDVELVHRLPPLREPVSSCRTLEDVLPRIGCVDRKGYRTNVWITPIREAAYRAYMKASWERI